MHDIDLNVGHLTPDNRQLLELLQHRDHLHLIDPERYLPILRPCRVRVLLVADGGLDFSMGGFGLRTFVQTLRTTPGFHVRFDITVAHINNVSDDAVMVGQPGIVRSIKQFKFDDSSHFTPACTIRSGSLASLRATRAEPAQAGSRTPAIAWGRRTARPE